MGESGHAARDVPQARAAEQSAHHDERGADDDRLLEDRAPPAGRSPGREPDVDQALRGDRHEAQGPGGQPPAGPDVAVAVQIALDDGGNGIPAPAAWLISLLGVAGLVAAIALLRSAAWATPAVLTVGALNLTGAVVALVRSWDGAVIGLVLSAVGTGLALAYAVGRPAKAPQTS
ncbi:hypothetical protein [Streptomyces sp. NTH33]|uniref:hypothetical protein n=1 Tax=Streptomyces sp. NTH33 TaxID=1735453 RepID=UPI0011B93B5B|nr:hypothetical protein [Streptomyces sp. NTH33]